MISFAPSQNIEKVYSLLQQIPDPEIPVISILELGIVRSVEGVEGQFEIRITPTYNACPALFTIKEDIEKLMEQNGISVRVLSVLSPSWTTDWISKEGREKLLKYGISPPVDSEFEDLKKIGKLCPRCYSKNTKEISRFGSTLCKATYQCNDCLEPFDYFKCH